jgi:hypothetical protein
MNKKTELLNKYSKEVGGDDYITIEGFLNWLVKYITRLEEELKLFRENK